MPLPSGSLVYPLTPLPATLAINISFSNSVYHSLRLVNLFFDVPRTRFVQYSQGVAFSSKDIVKRYIQ